MPAEFEKEADGSLHAHTHAQTTANIIVYD